MPEDNPFAALFAKAGLAGTGEPDVPQIEPSADELAEAAFAQLKMVVLGFEKRKGNKVVTSVRDVPSETQQSLMKQLRKVLGAGASLTEGLIVFQGDHRAKLAQWFESQGVRVRGERGDSPS
ncbi:MAG: translation initiation factor [Planctomycetes bacterium]|nr:translation initiation factor [Planctomycetota bacterium]